MKQFFETVNQYPQIAAACALVFIFLVYMICDVISEKRRRQ